MWEVGIAVSYFTMVIVMLAIVIVAARALLVPTGEFPVVVNDDRTLSLVAGKKLLAGLGDWGVFLPSACGGRGTCGQCRVKVLEGGGPMLPSEAALISPRQAAEHERLACQVAVREAMRIRVPDGVLAINKLVCITRSTRSVATYIKEIVLDLPSGTSLDFRAGSYVQVECPEYDLSFRNLDISAEYRPDWDRLKFWRYESHVRATEIRAYSFANYPGEVDGIMLNVRIALPPPGSPESIPPGRVSTYLFGLKPGDEVLVTGPYGEAVAHQTDNEMVFIGGGAGMAPMRSLILDQLLRIKTARKISFWYGTQNLRELFYADLFDRLQKEHENFEWHVALMEPGEGWTGASGFVHETVFESYLKDHTNPEMCEYYLCGPPLMSAAVIEMLRDLGVEDDHITVDDFAVADARRQGRVRRHGG